MTNEFEITNNLTNLTIYKKLFELQTMPISIEKGGYNAFDKYKYKRFTDIKSSVLKKLKEVKIVIQCFGEIENFQLIQFINTKGNNDFVVSYLQHAKLVDIETGEYISFVFPIIGRDTDPSKAEGKAITYAAKYIFNTTFLIPDESMDPDTTENTKNNAAVKQEVPKKRTKEQVDKLKFDLYDKYGIEIERDILETMPSQELKKIIEERRK